MINRVLIRIKVVQLLYSYLLIENPFSIESQPSAPTKEKRFAYGLYLDMLSLMVNVAGKIEKRGGERPLYQTRFISRLLGDDKFKSHAAKYRTHDFPFKSIENYLVEVVRESAIYKRFIKADTDSAERDRVWKEIFDHLIFNNAEVNALIAKRENYTLRGVDRMRDMMEDTFSKFFASADHLPDALKTLEMSLSKSHELYYRLLSLCVALTNMRRRQIDDAHRKFLKTEEDINPNMRFVENEFVKALEQTPEYVSFIEHFKISWIQEDELLVRKLLNEVMESDIYRQYMEFPATDFQNDCEFWREIYKNVILRSEYLLEELEEKSVFWNDDLDTIGTFLLKTIRRYSDGIADPLIPKYKDDEDARFGAELFSYVVRNKDAYRNMIDNILDKEMWDSERLAFMDVVIVMTALAEILHFPKVPLKVSLYEYIEIAKCYSLPKSGSFVHGLLSDIITQLKEEGKLHKN